MTEKYDIVLQQSESTVVNEFIPQEIDLSKDYESEAKLEASFIKQLISLGYEESKIHTHPELLANLRSKIELLNK
jgi:type I restriction enzyme R subunit